MMSPIELFFGKKVHCVDKPRIFGVMGLVTTRNKVEGKLKELGTICVFWLPSQPRL